MGVPRARGMRQKAAHITSCSLSTAGCPTSSLRSLAPSSGAAHEQMTGRPSQYHRIVFKHDLVPISVGIGTIRAVRHLVPRDIVLDAAVRDGEAQPWTRYQYLSPRARLRTPRAEWGLQAPSPGTTAVRLVDVHNWMSHQQQLDDRQRPSATIGNGHRQRSAAAIGNTSRS